MDDKDTMKALFVIVNMGFADEVVDLVRDAGIKGATIIHSQGTCSPQDTVMGIAVDPQKEMILAIVDEQTADRAMAAVKEKTGKDTPARSVCFTMPVDKTVGL